MKLIIRLYVIFSSLFIASYEAFKDNTIETVKFFFNCGLTEGEFNFSDDYKIKIKSKDKNIFKATLLWLKEIGAIDEKDMEVFYISRDYRNKLAHELMTLLFECLPEELPEKFINLIQLKIKIEKWWLLNIEIPSDSDFDSIPEIKEEDILTSSQIFNQIIFDMLSGDEKKATYYYNEFKKQFNK